MSLYVQNVGAKDGLAADPLLVLLEKRKDIAGLALEPSERFFPLLKKNMERFPHMKVSHAGVAPSTASEVLNYGPKDTAHGDKASPPQSMDIFKLDIDG